MAISNSTVASLLSYGLGGFIVLLPFSGLHFVWSKILADSAYFSQIFGISLSLVSWSTNCLSKPFLPSIQCLLEPLSPTLIPYKIILLAFTYTIRLIVGVVVGQLLKEIFDNVLPKVQKYLKAKSLVSKTAPSDVLRTKGNHFRSNTTEHSCAICLQEICDKDETYTHAHSCRRSFHRRCLQPWLQTSSGCPLDRVRYTYKPNFMRQNFGDAIDVAFVAIARSAEKGILESIFSSLPSNVFYWALWSLTFHETVSSLIG